MSHPQPLIYMTTHLNSLIIFSEISKKTLLTRLKSKKALLKEIRDSILTENEDPCKQIIVYIYNFGRDLNVKSGCVCVDDWRAIPNSIKEACVEAIHATYSGNWSMADIAVLVFWWYMHRSIISKTAKCTPSKKKV